MTAPSSTDSKASPLPRRLAWILPRVGKLLLILLVMLPVCWLFATPVFMGEGYAFRDAGHFYQPLFEWTAAQWFHGEVPLWNPLENTGQPLLADTSSSVLYPGKLIYAIAPKATLAFNLYVLAHFLLASWGAYRLARGLNIGEQRISPMAACLSAICYPLAGSVLIQYSNVVFLVGAAWMPWAMLAAWKTFSQRRVSSSLCLGMILALMTLGGDPQAAYHAGLLTALLAVLFWRQARKSSAANEKEPVTRQRFLQQRFALLALAAISGGLLAAVQILPAAEWTRDSDRGIYGSPRSVWQLPGYLSREEEDDGDTSAVNSLLLAWPDANSHHEEIYQFSLGPWRLAELIWPNFAGEQFPVHRRWLRALPCETDLRLWSPSLYLGLLPIVLALAAFRLWGDSASLAQRWFSWIVLLSVLASFGEFGLGWLAYQISGWEQAVGPAFGGLYWLLTVLLPSYDSFRYPEKWMTVAAMAFSMLAAIGWDASFTRGSKRLRMAWLIFAAASAILLLVAELLQQNWQGWVRDVPPDDLFGPLDAAGARKNLIVALISTGILSALFYLLTWKFSRVNPYVSDDGQRRLLMIAALVITAGELIAANGRLVQLAPEDSWKYPPALAEEIWRDAGNSTSRVYRGTDFGWYPPQWTTTSSPDRLREAVVWERGTLLPKYNLPLNLTVVESPGTITSYDVSAAFGIAREYGTRRADGQMEPHQSLLDALSVQYLIVPKHFAPGDALLVEDAKSAVPSAELYRNRSPHFLPRAWVVDIDKIHWQKMQRRTPFRIQENLREVFFPDDRLRDFVNSAVVEYTHDFCIERGSSPPPPGPAGSCRIVEESPRRIVIEADLERAGLLVLNDLYAPGWKCTVGDGENPGTAEILRTNQIMRGILLTGDGKHRVVIEYQPNTFYAGAWISGLSWLVLLATAIFWRRK